MATIGDPLADLGYMVMHWTQPDDPRSKFNLHTVTRLPGFPSREELVTRYEERSGRSMQALSWYVTLALWKAIVFMEGNYKRALAGSTDDPYLKAFGDGVIEIAQRAVDVSSMGSEGAAANGRYTALLVDYGGVLTSSPFLLLRVVLRAGRARGRRDRPPVPRG